MARSANDPFEQRWKELADEALNEAAKLPVGSRARDAMLKKVRQLEVACQMSAWISSPGLRPPQGMKKLVRPPDREGSSG